MALTFDTKLRIPATALTTTTGAPTADFTCGANAEVLVVMVMWAGTTARTGGAPTYNSVALTQASTQQGVTEASCELWYMLAPPTGSALSVSVPNGGGLTMWVYVASGNAAVDTTCALDSVGQNATTGANPNTSITTVAANTLIFAVVATGDNLFAPTARTGTSLYEEDIATYGSAGQYYNKAGTGAGTIDWTDATSDDYGAIAAAFKEVTITLTISKSEGVTLGETVAALLDALAASISEGVTVGEAVTVTIEIEAEPDRNVNINIEPTVTLGEAVAAVMGDLTAEVSDGVTVGEAAAVLPNTLNPTKRVDNIALGESSQVEIAATTLSASVTDGLTLADILPGHYSDDVRLGELVTVEFGAVADLDVNVSDGVTVGEAAAVVLDDLVLSQSENVTLGEIAAVSLPDALAVAKAENVTLGEAITVTLDDLAVSQSENVTLGETADADVVEAGGLSITAADNLTLGEAAAASLPDALQVSQSEGVTLGEQATEALDALAIAQTEGVTIGETSAASLPDALAIPISENLTMGEAVNVVMPVEGELYVTVSDNLTLGEAVTVSLPDALALAISEGATLGEAVTVALGAVVTLAITAADGITLADTSAALLPNALGVTISDGVTLGEAITVTVLDAGARLISITDGITLAESTSIALPDALAISRSDNLGLGENVTISSPTSDIDIVVTDSTEAGDVANVILAGIFTGLINLNMGARSGATRTRAREVDLTVGGRDADLHKRNG